MQPPCPTRPAAARLYLRHSAAAWRIPWAAWLASRAHGAWRTAGPPASQGGALCPKPQRQALSSLSPPWRPTWPGPSPIGPPVPQVRASPADQAAQKVGLRPGEGKARHRVMGCRVPPGASQENWRGSEQRAVFTVRVQQDAPPGHGLCLCKSRNASPASAGECPGQGWPTGHPAACGVLQIHRTAKGL